MNRGNITKKIKFEDNYIKIHFYMNHKGVFIIVDKTDNKVIEDFFPPREPILRRVKDLSRIYKEYEKNIQRNNVVELDKSILFYEKKESGMGHSTSVLMNYLLISKNMRLKVILPNTMSDNLIKLINRPFGKKIIILEPNKVYNCNRFFLSKYINLMHPLNGSGTKMIVPVYQSSHFPLIYEQKCVEWFRSKMNVYIDYTHRPKKYVKHTKIFVGKFEGQGQLVKNKTIQLPRSDYGFIDNELLSRFERNDFVNIDPYTHDILDVIWYIRHCKELIISTGTAAHLYSPYVSKETMVYYMTNIIGDNGVNDNNGDKNTHLNINNNEYALHTMGIQWYNNYRICFYKSDPKWRNNPTHRPLYKGEDMLDFLSE